MLRFGAEFENLFVGAYGIKYDGKTNLHYMRYRWYSNDQMRFLSPDLLLGINRYSYALGNPIRVIDPSGMVDIIIYHEVGSDKPGDKNSNWEMRRVAETLKKNHYPNARLIQYKSQDLPTAQWMNGVILNARVDALLNGKESEVEHLILIGHSAADQGMSFSKRKNQGNLLSKDINNLRDIAFKYNCKNPRNSFDYQIQIYACSGGFELSEKFRERYGVSTTSYKEGVPGNFAKTPETLNPRHGLPIIRKDGKDIIDPKYQGPLYMVPNPLLYLIKFGNEEYYDNREEILDPYFVIFPIF